MCQGLEQKYTCDWWVDNKCDLSVETEWIKIKHKSQSEKEKCLLKQCLQGVSLKWE